MLSDGKTAFLGDADLTSFNFRIVEFFHSAAFDTDQMIVVFPFIQLKNSFA